MPCYHPTTAWRSKEVNQASGKRSLVFSAAKGVPGSKLEIPCRNCIGCRLDNARQWAIRLTHERPYHELSCFLTLTYNPHCLPSNGSLDKTHFQLFMKRLRMYHHYNNPDAPKIKYFMCGEYGGNTDRPHYHAIIFGLDFADKRQLKKTRRGDTLWTSKKLDELWGLGHCFIGSVSYQSVGYVARYCIKKVNGNRALEHYQNVDTKTGEIHPVIKEYIAASQGLGLRHFETHHHHMYLRDHVVIQGKEAPVPRYYDRKLEQIDPAKLEQIKAKRKERALLAKDDNTPARLAVKEEVKQAQVKMLKRELHDD